MHRYVAMIWDEHNVACTDQAETWGKAIEERSGWKHAFNKPGLRVSCFSPQGSSSTLTDFDGRGLAVGAVFERGSGNPGRRRHLSSTSTDRIIRSGGDFLVRDHWGGYVAFWKQENDKIVARDPTGATPCFMTLQSNVLLLFSHAEDVTDLCGTRFSIDWQYLRCFLRYNYFITKHTGLNEIKELLPGQKLTFTAGRPLEFTWLWNAATIAASPSSQTAPQATEHLRELAEDCFKSWGSTYGHALVSLSGGLDSSIVAALLAQSATCEVSAIHNLGRNYESHEVVHAKALARHIGVPIIIVQMDPSADRIENLLTAPRQVRPRVQELAVLLDEMAAREAVKLGADCFMTGQGGDNLFQHRAAARCTLTDYVRTNGFGSQFWSIAYQASILQRQSVWQVLFSVASQTPWRPYAFLKKPEWTSPSLLNETADIGPPDYRLHPWLLDAQHLPPNKADHLLSIISLFNYYTLHGRGIDREVVLPFVSQPIVEFALRAPSYVLADGGLDRALERRAFADLLPEAIVRRTAKGGADHYLLEVMRMNRPFLRDLLLEGHLRKTGWIDEAKLNSALSENYIADGGGAIFLYLLIAAEAWLQRWIDGPTLNHPGFFGGS